MTTKPIKFGILGCAFIARKLSRAILLSRNATISAAGSRSFEKAAEFAKQNGFPDSAKVYDSYDAVLDDPEVDAVYIPLPTSLHVEWAVRAARKYKHVLLEKPVALNVEELDKILAACESNGVQFMDSTMWMHHPRTAEMKEFLSDTSLFGELRTVHSSLTFAATEDFLENDIRIKPDLDALGALGDVGWYCIRSILWAVDYEQPNSVQALPETIFNKAGVILSCSASLHWENGKTAIFHCSFLSNVTMDLTVIGTKGRLSLHDFVIPYEENKGSYLTAVKSGFNEGVTRWESKMRNNIVRTEFPQEVFMVSEFCRLVGSVKFEGGEIEKKGEMVSRKTQLVLDAIKVSIERDCENVCVLS